MLDLAKGHPDPELLPALVLAEACKAAAVRFADGAKEGLRYGSQHRGSPAFLAQLTDFLHRQCPGELRSNAESLLLTNGVSHGLDLAAAAFAGPGDAVIVEAPTYFLAMGIFRSRGLEVIPAPTDSQGLLVEEVERILDERPSGSAEVRLLYTVPVNHNPTGATLPESRRKALVQLAQRRGLVVLADEVYHLLDWRAGGQRPPRMVCFDPAFSAAATAEADVHADSDSDPTYRNDYSVDKDAAAGQCGTVVSVSSFTKILAPGLRVGWVEAAPGLVAKLAASGYMISGGCVTAFMTEALLQHSLESSAADRALQGLCETYRMRAECLASALRAQGLAPLVEPTGGYFAWVSLGADASEVARVAKEHHGLTFMQGSRCDESRNPELAHAARLCFAWLRPDELEEGVRRLAAALAQVKAGAPVGLQ